MTAPADSIEALAEDLAERLYDVADAFAAKHGCTDALGWIDEAMPALRRRGQA